MAKKEQQEENVRFYEHLRSVPEHAKRKISGGRLNNFTDINPMWRIKTLTEAFGPCGIGWKYEIVKQWSETYGNEVKSFTNINLYIKVDGQWSEPIPGTGGATLVEAKGYVSDEGYKMSLTDALSVSMKALGVGADIYFGDDAKYDTKYDQQEAIVQMNGQKNVEKAASTSKDNADPFADNFSKVKSLIDGAVSVDALMAIWNENKQLQSYAPFKNALSNKRKELTGK